MRASRLRIGLALALLLSVGCLLGASAVTHSHHGDAAQSQCTVCRWASEATPALVGALVLLLTLPESGRAVVLVHAYRPQPHARRGRARAPPFV